MPQLKYYDGERFRGAPKFRELPEPVGDPLFWWPLHAGYQSETTGFGQGTLHGPQWRRGNWAGGWALEGDGVDDYVATSDCGDFGSEMDTDFSIVFTVETEDTDTFRRIIRGNNDDGTRLDIATHFDDEGEIRFRVDGEENTLSVLTDGYYTDGEIYRVVCRKSGNTASDLDVFSNGEKDDVTIDVDDDGISPSDFDEPLWFLTMREGNRAMNGVIDNVMIYDYSLTEDEIEEDYRRQPWSEVN